MTEIENDSGEKAAAKERPSRWDHLFTSGPRASNDFMRGRDEPAVEEREPL
jgi:virulence-associated protein VagC